MGNLETLPPNFGRHRLLDTAQTAEFLGLSVPHLRRLYREGKVPQPVKIGVRKNGWRVGTLTDFVAAKAGSAA